MNKLEKGHKNKILILAPHQDDEIILCGLFLKGMIDDGCIPYVVFSTNGDYESGIGEVRLKESLDTLALYGVPEDNIIFMGYANEYASDGPHIYDARDGQVVCSQYGNNQTFGLDTHPEYCYVKEGIHHLYTRENFKKDMYGILIDIMPDVIFATDAEIHPDHKANSLMLDEVLGMMLREYEDYKPLVLKKENYAASWWGEPDYTCVNNKESRFVGSTYVNFIRSQFYNPYIRWKDRIRLPIDKYVKEMAKEKNIVWKALNVYKSQDAITHYERLLSSDVCFWQRRTDSLTYTADISVSSGEASYLNDFKLYDTTDISRRSTNSWELNAGIWHPEENDDKPCITIELKEETELEDMMIYQEFGGKAQITGGRIVIDKNTTIEVGSFEKKKTTNISLNGIKGKRIDFIIDKYEGRVQDIGIGEIEIYRKKPEYTNYIKLLVDNNFVYDYVMDNSQHRKLKIYRYSDKGSVSYSDLDSVEVNIYDSYGCLCEMSKYISKAGYIKEFTESYIKLFVRDRYNQNLTDEVYIFRNVKSFIQFKKEMRLFASLGLTDKEIKEYFDSSTSLRLDMLKQWCCIALAAGKKMLAIRIKSLFVRDFSKVVGMLSDEDKKDAYMFIRYNEYRKGISNYIKQYRKGLSESYYKESEEPIVYFVGSPDHQNIGDHAIATVTMEYIQDMMPGTKVREISIDKFARRLPDLKRKISDKDIIVLQGGGNMGNIYWRNERIRWEIIKNFPDNRIYIFPETIYYDETAFGQAEKAISEQIYNNHNKLTICAREQVSFDIMKELYPKCNVLLTPDIVCYTSRWKEVGDRNGALLMLRSDIEKSIEDTKFVGDTVEKMGYSISYADMMYQKKGYIGKYNRDRIVSAKISQLSKSELVVTDRLHGMILSAITGTPCVVFWGYNHKIKSYYDTWFKDVSYIELIDNVSELENAMARVLDKEANKEPLRKLLKQRFDVLKLK